MAECRTLAALFHPGGFCSSGSFATLAAIRRASSFVSILAAEPAGLFLVIDVGELLPATVLHDERGTGASVLD